MGATRTADRLKVRGISVDPYIQKLLQQAFRSWPPSTISKWETSSPSLLQNTAGYRFNQRDNEVRDNVTVRLDYNLSTRHVFTGSHTSESR